MLSPNFDLVQSLVSFQVIAELTRICLLASTHRLDILPLCLFCRHGGLGSDSVWGGVTAPLVMIVNIENDNQIRSARNPPARRGQNSTPDW